MEHLLGEPIIAGKRFVVAMAMSAPVSAAFRIEGFFPFLYPDVEPL
jgi:hypothetical protein